MKSLDFLMGLAVLGAASALFACSAARAAPGGAPAEAATASDDVNEGEVRKVDREAGKITVKHGVIKSLDMPPMTMVFHVGDAAMLDRVNAGERIRFKVSHERGKLIITEIRPAR